MGPTIGLLVYLITSVNNNNSPLPTQKSIFLEKTQQSVVLNVPFIHQVNDLPEEMKNEVGDTACGPSALTMVLRYLNYNYTLGEVINKLPSSVYVKGTGFYNLYDGAKVLSGLESHKIKYSPIEIYQNLYLGRPIIINVQAYDGYLGHAMVVVGIKGYDGEKAESLIINDPFRDSYREFKITGKNTLKQPEGQTNYVGTLDPFYIE